MRAAPCLAQPDRPVHAAAGHQPPVPRERHALATMTAAGTRLLG
jgi:hypothetical protein